MQDLRLVIGNKNYSSWSLCPWLLLKMFDVNFEEIHISLYQDNTAEKLGPYSPSLKVPVLLHKEVTVWDSLAICEYVSEVLLGGAGWPGNPKRRANARSICAEMHSEFPHLKTDWPMNCKASYPMKPTEAITNEIARIDAIWSCTRRRFGETGNYLFGRFSIADCLFAPVAVCFEAYGAELSSNADTYLQTLLDNPFIQKWITDGRREKEPMSIAYANSA
ncbi:MAG: glutathione S-transferase family protein [Gammaproteobacteria bacterium]|nr:glutathione S-transferase family protein [Gammaproteobacteria bacterium]MCY4357170.1 glutathione S-transferase family protein [Gammaproteobacteria bacterium]